MLQFGGLRGGIAFCEPTGVCCVVALLISVLHQADGAD